MLCSFWFVCFFGLSACLSRVCLVHERLLCCARFGSCAFSVCPRVCLVCVWFVSVCCVVLVLVRVFFGLSACLSCVCLVRERLLCCARFGSCAFSVCPRVCLVCVWFVSVCCVVLVLVRVFFGLSACLSRVCLVRARFFYVVLVLIRARFLGCARFGSCAFFRFVRAFVLCVFGSCEFIGLVLSLSLSLTHTHTHTHTHR